MKNLHKDELPCEYEANRSITLVYCCISTSHSKNLVSTSLTLGRQRLSRSIRYRYLWSIRSIRSRQRLSRSIRQTKLVNPVNPSQVLVSVRGSKNTVNPVNPFPSEVKTAKSVEIDNSAPDRQHDAEQHRHVPQNNRATQMNAQWQSSAGHQ